MAGKVWHGTGHASETQWPGKVGTYESEIFVRIESAVTIQIKSECSRLRVQCRVPQELCKS